MIEQKVAKVGKTEPFGGAHDQIAELVPKYHLPAEPTWERARDLLREVQQTVKAIVLLGLEITALREQWFAQGSRNDRNPFPTSSARGRSSEMGWHAKLNEELGITPQAALRLMEKAQYVCMLEDVTRGETVEYQDSRNREMVIEPTPEMKQMAFGFLSDVVAGTVNAKRAWAGLMGEGGRQAKSGGTQRAAVDYRKRVRPCAVTLRGAFLEWPRLDWAGMDDEMAAASAAARELLAALPETFRVAMAEIIVEKWTEREKAALAQDLVQPRGRRGR